MAANADRSRPGLARRLLSGLAGLVLVALVLLVGAALLLQSRIDPDALRRRIEAQCLQATGRTLTLQSVHLALLPVPTLSATGVGLSGLPTDSRPQMLRASAASAHLALWPLIHHVARLDGLTLSDPDLSLERDADGHANWRFTPLPKLSSGDTAGTPSGGMRWRVQINSLRLRDGTLAWHDAAGGWSGAVSLDRLDATDLAGDMPRVELAGRHGNAGFTATIATGSLSFVLDPASTPPAPWPLRFTASSSRNGRQDAALSVQGTLADPARGRGFAVDVQFDAAHPDGIDALFPHASIPLSGPASLAARLVDAAPASAPAPEAAVQRLVMRGEHLDLGMLLHRPWSQGLLLDRFSVDAADQTSPVAVSATVHWQGRPMLLTGTAATLDGLRGALMAPRASDTSGGSTVGAPFDLQLRAGDAKARLGGTVDRNTLRATVQATAPSLRAVLPVGPALTGLTVSAKVALSADRHLVIDGLDLRSDELALAGHAALSGGGHPVIDATLSSAHMNLDALRAGWVDPAPPTPPLNTPRPAAPLPSPMPDQPAASDQATPAGSPPTPPGEQPVPFGRLNCCDAAIRFTADAMIADGLALHTVAATLTLRNGALALSPVTAIGPAGPIDLSLEANAAGRTVSLQIRRAMLPAATLAAWLHREPVLDGAVEIVADLKATGDTAESMRRSVDGHGGVSMVDGSIATESLGQLIGRPQAMLAGSEPGRAGDRTGFRCLALPASLSGGVATLDPIALSTTRLMVQGRGTVTLAGGQLDLHLTPHLAIGASGASLPVRIGGTLDAPEAALDPAATGGRFSLSIGGAAPPDPCGTDLAAARFGVPGPLPGSGTGAATAEGKHKLPKPIDILRGLGLFH